MASPMFCEAEFSALKLSISTPITGDPFSFVASPANAALAIAALREDIDPDSSVVDALTDLTVSPMYQLAKASLERDLAEIERTQPSDALRRRSFVLDMFGARLFLAGARLAEVTHA